MSATGIAISDHICPTVNLMDQMAIVRNGQIVGHWKIAARGKVQEFALADITDGAERARRETPVLSFYLT